MFKKGKDRWPWMAFEPRTF